MVGIAFSRAGPHCGAAYRFEHRRLLADARKNRAECRQGYLLAASSLADTHALRMLSVHDGAGCLAV